jgi:hypothetical protein
MKGFVMTGKKSHLVLARLFGNDVPLQICDSMESAVEYCDSFDMDAAEHIRTLLEIPRMDDVLSLAIVEFVNGRPEDVSWSDRDPMAFSSSHRNDSESPLDREQLNNEFTNRVNKAFANFEAKRTSMEELESTLKEIKGESSCGNAAHRRFAPTTSRRMTVSFFVHGYLMKDAPAANVLKNCVLNRVVKVSIDV